MANLSCTQYAISYLSRYPKTEQEIRIILFKKGYSSEDVQKTLKMLKENDFINDEKFAQSYINSEISKKGKPIFLIKQKLQQRGISETVLHSAFSGAEEEMQEGIFARIQKEIQTYKKKELDGFEIIQKLMKKGYKLSDIKAVIKGKEE